MQTLGQVSRLLNQKLERWGPESVITSLSPFLKQVTLLIHKSLFKNSAIWDFPGAPVVKTSPSTTGGAGSIPGRGTKIPHAL